MPKKSKEKFASFGKCQIPITKPYICKMCGKELKSIPGLATHIKNQHDCMSYVEYLKTYYNYDVRLAVDDWEAKREDRKIEGMKKTLSKNKSLHLSPKDRLSDEQYDKWRKNMKKVFTLDWFISKYGEELGSIKYEERSKKVSEKSHFKIYNKTNKKNWSKISQELFWDIYKEVANNFKNIYFGELNHEYGCETCNNFDFVVKDNKKVIEFNGDAFHGNPEIYKEDDIPISFINKTAKQLREEDKIKIDKAKNNGYTIKIVWEKDYRNNKKKVTKECIAFLKRE